MLNKSEPTALLYPPQDAAAMSTHPAADCYYVQCSSPGTGDTNVYTEHDMQTPQERILAVKFLMPGAQ